MDTEKKPKSLIERLFEIKQSTTIENNIAGESVRVSTKKSN